MWFLLLLLYFFIGFLTVTWAHCIGVTDDDVPMFVVLFCWPVFVILTLSIGLTTLAEKLARKIKGLK